MQWKHLFTIALVAAIGTLTFSQSSLATFPWRADPVTIQARQLASFNAPVAGILNGGASPNDGTNRVFFPSLNGQVWVLQNDELQPQPFIDVSSLLSRDFTNPFADECGLVNIAFHPDFRFNGRFYLRYSARGSKLHPAHDVVIAEYQIRGGHRNQPLVSPGRVIYKLSQTQCQHTGGALFFGPDGKLYASFGHGAKLGDPIVHGQNPQEPYSAIIRLNVNSWWRIPFDNPFGNEVYAYGFRNPYGCSVDRARDRIYCADVGEANREEVNRIKLGGNYGFPILEGSACFPQGDSWCLPPENYVAPSVEYDHSVGRGVIGAVIYRGAAIPSLWGTMLVGDFGSGNPFDYVPGRLLAYEYWQGWQPLQTSMVGTNPHDAPVSLVQSEYQEIYFATVSLVDFQTRIYKVVGAQ